MLLAASGLVPLLVVLAWGTNYLVEERRTEAERSLLEVTRALGTALSAEFRGTMTLLDHMGTSEELEHADLRAFQLSARRTAEQLGWRAVVLLDSEGRVLMRTDEPLGSTATVPREEESLMRVIQTHEPVVSRAIDGRPGQGPEFAVRVPVMRGGQLIYVLSAVLPVERIGAVLSRQDIPAGSLVSVFDHAQRRTARSRPTPSVAPTASLKQLLDRPGASAVGRTRTFEGIDNYTAFTRLPDTGWYVVAGTSVAEVNRGLWALLSAVVAGLVTSLGLAVFLAWVLSRKVIGPIEVLKEGAAALGRGDPVELPALDIVELEDVAQALKHAAHDRDRAAAQVQEALRDAEEANRSKDQFMAMLGHELRNPLAPITNAVQIMALKGDEATATERHIIERQLVHVNRLVDDLLDVSRITSGRLMIRREPVRISEVLTQVVDTVGMSLFQRELSVDLDPQLSQAWVLGDETRLAQIFNNLLVNAIKFTPPGGSIRVHAVRHREEVQVAVEDSGVGMTQEDLERVFDLFYQAPQSADRARGGLGLGLPIVRSLVSMHGGSVVASSAGPGKGSCVTVHLPLCPAPRVAEPRPAVQPAHGGGHVLVVDDNEDAADTCGALLELSGYTVRTAYTPQAALQALSEFSPDLAILDIGLPGMSGYELAASMKAAGYRGRMVALTGYGQAADLAASRQAGFDSHLTKPVTPAALLALVDRLLNHTATA
jgi:signal transduction histidine kinase/ActR/RegA family two-component response regulator